MDLSRLVNDRRLLSGLIIVLVIVPGLVAGLFLSGPSWFCTEMGCPCQGVEGERSCNSCFSTDYIFFTGLINVKQRCTAPEMIECRNGKQVDRRVDYTQQSCQSNLELLGVNGNYLFNDPDQAVSGSPSRLQSQE